jgi:allophanate hydrolase subunit 2
VLGSRSHATLSGIGPPPLAAGDVLALGPDPQSPMPTDLAPRPPIGHRVRLWAGPQRDELPSATAFVEASWTVTAETSRVGVRLAVDPAGEAAVVAAPPPTAGRSRPSEGLVEGAVQLTPSGELIVMLANHPTTGGYPVVAVVDPDDVVVVAQSPPGTTLDLRWVG